MALGFKSTLALAAVASLLGAGGYQLYTRSLIAADVATYRAPLSTWPDFGPEVAPSGARGMFADLTVEEALGQDLFNDLRLSSDGTVACRSCHMGSHGFADQRAFSLGVGRQEGPRNSPSLLGVGRREALHWDGSVASLEEQLWHPLLDPKEMGLASKEAALAPLREDRDLQMRFKAVYDAEITPDTFAAALSAYLRTLEWQSQFDRFLEGDAAAMTDVQVYGLSVFRQSGCMACHFGPDLTDGDYHVILPPGDDLGRFAVTGEAADRGAFRTPSLRHVSKTAPYFHNGQAKDLTQVIRLHPETPQLSQSELDALHYFLEAL